ncbi:MAG: ATP-dependent zinc metalloprotease FtsH [Candidatus Omnitrophota bacterium]|nr:ATP-dependent zinc metalloprotease FtsH [Candidatus Omnitrophota bacterium]
MSANLPKLKPKLNKLNSQKKPNIFWMLIILALFYVINFVNIAAPTKEIKYGDFYRLLKENPSTGNIVYTAKIDGRLEGQLKDKTKFFVLIPDNDKDLIPALRENIENFEIKTQPLLISLLFSLGPVLLLILFWWLMASRGEQLGNRIMGFGKIRPKLAEEGKNQKITFKDVAGVDEAKEELQEVIEFLKDPKKFQKLGGKIPKGVLLVGPPGCGKTLLAKAVAGEAEVPFFSISGSEVVEMFVGVGASRVRDLFEQGRKAGKASGKGAIIFIDEIDAVGRLRFAGIGGGHYEREQTLNQLLVEMDGFDTVEGLILIAATNRPDTLDPALLRPGRFDRHIVVNLPDIVGREEILKVHVRKIKLSPNVNLRLTAQHTSMFSGADLANLCNEAALLAARRNKEAVEQVELEAAIERVMIGPEKKSKVMSKREKELTAFHEAGHAILSLLVPEVNPVTKVSIIPRGMAGGYTLTPPIEDRSYRSKKEFLGEITILLGGRVSEELSFGDVTTGAGSDLENATHIAKKMICSFGMSERLGNITLGRAHGPLFLGRDIVEERNYSEDTARMIDEEVKRIVDECYAQAKKLLQEKEDKLKLVSSALLEKEVLDGAEVRRLLGLEPKPEPQLEISSPISQQGNGLASIQPKP